MENDRPIALFSTGIGRGNPLAVRAMDEDLRAAGYRTQLKITNNPLTWWASWRQSRVTNNEDRRENYNNNYHETRNNWQAVLFGFATLLQLAYFLHQTKANKLLIAQELPLTALGYLDSPIIAALLHQLQEIVLLVPDVYAKSNAVETVTRLQNRGFNLQFAVWNQAASDRLKQQQLRHHLISPWLIPKIAQPSARVSSVASIRPSGTGINPDYLNALPLLLDDLKLSSLKQYLLEEKDLVELGKNGKPMKRHHKFFTSLRHALTATLHMNPKLLVGYPSELVGVATQFRQAGWQGEYLMLPERGLHEQENSLYASMHGLGQQLQFANGRLSIRNQLQVVPTDKIDDLVGHQPLSQILK